jgi:predicted GNAT family N-acyltransferase
MPRVVDESEQFKPVYQTRFASAKVSPGGYVYNVATNVNMRGQGHGTELMNQITADADRMGKSLTLHARTELHPWYQRLGFEHEADDFNDFSGTSMPRLVREPR